MATVVLERWQRVALENPVQWLKDCDLLSDNFVDEPDIPARMQYCLDWLADSLDHDEWNGEELTELALSATNSVNNELSEYGFVVVAPKFTGNGMTSQEKQEVLEEQNQYEWEQSQYAKKLARAWAVGRW